ncbi:MAG: ribose-phosphate diphosphokinase [Desulfurococcaceae archaeon]|nr:ribose-phosphate diphosphokinase [Desulfurococcaceae archaeon]
MFVCLSGVPKSVVEGLKHKCGRKVYVPLRKFFPDGEQYLRFELEYQQEKIFVIQSTYPEQDRKIVELYLALEALQGLGVGIEGIAVLYVAYARQDKRFLKGEPVSVKALYQGLKQFGIKRLVTVDVHTVQPFIDMGFEIMDILPHSYMLSKTGVKVDLVLAPDKGALHRAEAVARFFSVPYDYLDKFRDRVTGEIKVDTKILDVSGKNIAIVDDIISTGKTLAKAAEILYRLGANKVYGVVTHALISDETLRILSASNVEKLVIANTIEQGLDLPRWVEVIDISELLCEKIG